MRYRRSRFRFGLGSTFGVALLALVICPLTGWSQEPQWEWEGVRRIVAVGDVHGAYDNLVIVLQNAELIDEKLRWIGGDAHLVQNGDIVDRGPDSRKAMDLLMDLQEKAADAGGRVHVLIGNHEAMNVVGILDLVSPKEFEAFVQRDSRRQRENTFARYYDGLRRDAKEKGEEAPSKHESWEDFQKKYPLGYIEHRQAFAPDGTYGNWILSHNVAIKINDTVFSHGDWSEKFSAIGIAEVNQRTRRELSGEIPLQNGFAFDAESPLQYRGLARTTLTRTAQLAAERSISATLSNLDAKRMVVGHTLTSGVIESRFGGRHVSIDTGMLQLYRGGHRVALEIVGDGLRAIHDAGVIEVPAQMDEANYDAYIQAVSAVDPGNVDVQLKRVDLFQESSRTQEAVQLLEKLFTQPEFIPFRYRDYLGAYYEQQGRTELANEQYGAYIEGLTTLIEANPENVNLANLLARFCVDKGLELDLAEEKILGAIRRAPGNAYFLLTHARVLLAKEEYSEALAVVGGIELEEESDYELHYLTGLAYLGLNDAARAKRAFEHAAEAEPDREEAREQLNKLNGVPPLG